MPESDYVRVLDKDTGHTLTIRRLQLPHGNFAELDDDPLTPSGDPKPTEHASAATAPATAGEPPTDGAETGSQPSSPAAQTAETGAASPTVAPGQADTDPQAASSARRPSKEK